MNRSYYYHQHPIKSSYFLTLAFLGTLRAILKEGAKVDTDKYSACLISFNTSEETWNSLDKKYYWKRKASLWPLT